MDTPLHPDSHIAWTVGVLIFLLVVVIVYTVVMFELYKSKKFVFGPYAAPPPPGDSFYPLGGVTGMTPEEIKFRNCILAGKTDC